ncbi:hypothetical protein [Pseudoflavitalea sp. G-6-1-2]|uniref:hypothetical protein n=1 Tax=Pseudoflavitalea sp. G-6-1-2 TaxID=2728841 RepID=UPI003211DF44
MKKRTRNILIIAGMILLIPVWMWTAWLITPKKKLVVAIVDKTEISRQGQEHVSLTWVLNQERYTKTSSKPYHVSQDYFGFFPQQGEQFRVKGLERFTPAQLDQLSNDCKAAYYTDTYGVFSNEWFSHKNVTERSGLVYGGMSKEDIALLQLMKDKHKTIITEFNTIGSPTAPEIRQQFEQMFGLKWTGWIGRYFESLDTTTNKELPQWLVGNYLKQHNNQWSFKNGGVAFVNDKDEIEILEAGTHLNEAVPHIITGIKGQTLYQLPSSIKYSFWFDVVQPDSSINQVIAQFRIDANDAGMKLLKARNIPAMFPAVTQHTGKDYKFYYFSADFCDNPVGMGSSYFRGISFFKFLFYDSSNPMERKSFFWNYYRPLMTTILDELYREQ